jgi:hypothetical protein
MEAADERVWLAPPWLALVKQTLLQFDALVPYNGAG